MNYKIVKSSEGRKNLPKILKEIDEHGHSYIFTVHGVPKAVMVDLALFEEFIENTEYGISEAEILARSNEETISFEDLKQEFNV